MANLLVVVDLISYGPEISHCAYVPKLNHQAERQHVCAPYWLWSHTHDFSFQSVAAHSHGVSSPPMLYDYHLNYPFINRLKGIKFMGVKGLNPYIISNGANSVVECTLRLYANSIKGIQSSQFFKFF